MTTVVADAHVVKLYRSDDLIHWSFLSDFTLPDVPHAGALWEMPDLVPLPVDDDPRHIKWVMIVNVNPWSIAGGSGAMYFVGNFDGRAFVPDRVAPAGSDPAQFRWVDHGADFYAAGTFGRAGRTPRRDCMDEQLGLCGESADGTLARRDDVAARVRAEDDRRRTHALRDTGRRVRCVGRRAARRA